MRTLGREAFNRARQFLKTRARPLEAALFAHRFEGALVERVTAELASYRNEDGGFGRALEPDLRTPSSSALATGIALRLLRELQCPADHALVRGAVEYLLATFDEKSRVWRVAPHDTNAFPHAPWWHDEAGSLARTFDSFMVIPRAELVGLLHHYSPLVPADWLDDLTERTVADIEALGALGSGGGDTLAYALALAETEELPQHFKRRVTPRVRAVAPNAVERDLEKWNTYCISPLKIVSSPGSIVADLLWDDLQRNLDYLVDHQTTEGTWEPTWSWGDFYPEVWEQARQEWRGHLTLNNLVTLQDFDRLRE